MTRRLEPVEWLLLVYLGLTTVVALLRISSYPRAGGVLVANGLTALLILLVARVGRGGGGAGMLRQIYPLLLLLALYASLDLLNGGGAIATHDQIVQRWEQALFGMQVSREWWRRAPSGFWSMVFHSAYLSYYILIPLPVAYFAWRRDWTSVGRTVLLLMATFLACYVVFLVYPVAGPYYEFERPVAGFVANLPARLVYGTLAEGSAYGAAFPSSHVAATVVATGTALAGARRLGLLMAPFALLLTVGVVYTQMHYAVDVLAGLIVAVIVGVLAWATSREGKPHDERPPPTDSAAGARVRPISARSMSGSTTPP